MVENNKMKLLKKKKKSDGSIGFGSKKPVEKPHAGDSDKEMAIHNDKMNKKKSKSKKKNYPTGALSGHNSPHQNRGSQGKLNMKKKSKTKKKNWIAGAIKKPGALHAEMGVKQGTKIPEGKLAAAADKGGKLGQRARLAQTLEGFHKKKSKMSSGQAAYIKRVGKKGMGGNC